MWGGMSILALSPVGQLAGFVLSVAIVFALSPLEPQLAVLGVDPRFQAVWLTGMAFALIILCCAVCAGRRIAQRDAVRTYRNLTMIAHSIGMYAVIAICVMGADHAFNV